MKKAMVWIGVALGVALGSVGCSDRKATLGNDIPITSENFPDEVFRKYLADEFDLDKSGTLEESELQEVRKVGLKDSDLRSNFLRTWRP